jgi:hypothetical protein
MPRKRKPPPEPGPAPPGAQPRPLETSIHGYSATHATIFRHWKAGDAERCTRCAECCSWKVPDRPGKTCQVWVPKDQLFDVCFGESRVTRDAALNRVDEEPGPERRPPWWTCVFTFTLGGGGYRVKVCIASRRRWDKLAADGGDYANHWSVTGLWGPLVMALRLTVD